MLFWLFFNFFNFRIKRKFKKNIDLKKKKKKKKKKTEESFHTQIPNLENLGKRLSWAVDERDPSRLFWKGFRSKNRIDG